MIHFIQNYMIKLKNLIKNFSTYLKTVIFQWVTLIGVLLTAYDYIQVFLPESFHSFQIPNKYITPLQILCLIIATYRAWLIQKRENDLILTKITKFKVVPFYAKISVSEHLKRVEKEIKEMESKRDSLPVPSQNYLTSLIPSFSFFEGSPDRNTYDGWISSLKKYKNEIKEFQEKNKDIIVFDFQIIANRYDENVGIQILISGMATIKNKIDLDYPYYPIKESSLFPSFRNLPKMDFSNRGDIYRTNIIEEKKNASCNLRYVKKDEKTLFFNDYLFLHIPENTAEFKVTINSKEGNGIQEFNFVVNKNEVKEIYETTDDDFFSTYMSS